MKAWKGSAAWIIVVWAGGVCAQEPQPRDTAYDKWAARMDQAAEKLYEMIPVWMDSAKVPGLSMAAAWRGELVGASAFGKRSVETGEPVDKATVFEAASLSKPVFSYAVLKLVEKGLLDLDAPLMSYLPMESLAGNEHAWKITARRVLMHSTGFPNWAREEPLDIMFEPGLQFHYSGEGYVYLARVIEKLAGKPLETLMQDLVFGPLDMTSSSYLWQEEYALDQALGHDEEGKTIKKQKPEEANAAASLHTTAADYAKFLAAIQRREGLYPESFEEWFAPQIDVAEGVQWALGWGLQETSLGPALWHWGDNSGYKSFTINLPRAEFGMVVLTNSDNGLSLMRHVLAIVLPGEQKGLDWAGYESFNSPQRIVRRRLTRVLRDQGVDAAMEEYHELKRSYPKEAFDEQLLNRIGYRLMRNENQGVADAIKIFKLNVEEYPDAWNVYDSLGEAFMVDKQYEMAIENYEYSLQLNPDNVNGRKMLEKLKGQL